MRADAHMHTHSEQLEKAGTVDFRKHPARKVGTRSRQCQPKVPGRFAFAVPEVLEFVAFRDSGIIYPAALPGLSQRCPREPPNRPWKQPQPFRVFWHMPIGIVVQTSNSEEGQGAN